MSSYKKFKWKTGVPDNFVHVMGTGYLSEFTLCGDSFDVDETDEGVKFGSGGLVETKEQLNCQNCINIINYCKSIETPKK